MRADAYLAKIGRYPSRNKAAEAIAREEVFADGKVVKNRLRKFRTALKLPLAKRLRTLPRTERLNY